MKLISLRPASILQLTLTSYALVGVPLVAALVTAILAVDRLAIESQSAVHGAALIIDAGRMTVTVTTAMERNARQYQLLGDPELFEVYLQRHKEFRHSIDRLRQTKIVETHRQNLNALADKEQQIHLTLKRYSADSKEVEDALTQFRDLRDGAREILSDSIETISQDMETMRRQAGEIQQRLLWQALAVIPAALALTALGTTLITRPIRQVAQAIRRLGTGHFHSPVEVRGPHDLEELGLHLDWLRQRLLELDEQKIRLLRHISHELKTPLTTLREGAQLLADRVVGPLNPSQADIAQILCNSCAQLQKHIEDLLCFNAVVKGFSTCVPHESTDLKRLLEHSISEQRVLLKAKNLVVETESYPVSVMGNREQLRVILDNILSNAIKYSPDGGRISVRLQQDDEEAVIEVRDEGPGIAADERIKIFQPFYQGRAVSDGHVKGTGLGLAITQEFIKAHGGHIEAADVPQGACIRLKIPLCCASRPTGNPHCAAV